MKKVLSMKNTNFQERLNICLDKEGFPPKNRGRIQLLAEMVGLTHRGASKWVNGQSAPPAKKFASLATKLKVSELWLRTGEGDMCDDVSANMLKKDQMYSADVPIYCLDDFLSVNKRIQNIIQCTLAYRGNFFGIILDTEAMSPRFPKGSIIIFDQTIAKDGDFVLVNYDEFPSPIFRQLLIIGGIHYLNAHNPKFDRLVLKDEKRIIGKLVQAILSFD
jgi:SOS-response transcriptional repressor LexA